MPKGKMEQVKEEKASEKKSDIELSFLEKKEAGKIQLLTAAQISTVPQLSTVPIQMNSSTGNIALALKQEQDQRENKKMDPENLINEAKCISHQISMVSRETPSAAIHTIATTQTISTIEKNTEAKKIVTDTIQQVITDTKIYGGLGTNSLFMGSRQATVLVNQLGTEDQKKQFSTEVMPEVVKTSIIAFKQLEKDCVTTLEKSITAGNLKSTLATWRDAYDKHKRFFKTVPDTQSEIIYQDIKEARTLASQCHEKGDHKLKELVERVSSDWIGGVFYAPLVKPILTPFVSEVRKWTLEEIDLFMKSYGTEAQIKKWNDRLPDLILDSEDPSSHIESTKMRIFLIKKDTQDVKQKNPTLRMSL